METKLDARTARKFIAYGRAFSEASNDKDGKAVFDASQADMKLVLAERPAEKAKLAEEIDFAFDVGEYAYRLKWDADRALSVYAAAYGLTV
jgi:hypothetical protein